MLKTTTQYILIFSCFIALGQAQFADDEYDKYTTVGQLGMVITNYGILGNGYNKINGEIIPSCLYRQHTEILREQVEHFSYAGLWVGGKVNQDRRVSTAIVDGAFESGEAGFEFFAASPITNRSSLQDARYFSTEAVSHQDMLMDFQDFGKDITGHVPMGIGVHLESYAWNFAFADAFVILDYTITNMSADSIHDVYAGLWIDASIGNMNYTSEYEPGGGFDWYDNLDGFDESEDDAGFPRDIAFQYDADGDDGWAESYIGITLLGSSTPTRYVDSFYHQWTWNNAANTDYPQYNMPLNDIQRYAVMTKSVAKGSDSNIYTVLGYPSMPRSWLFQLSAGPLGSRPADVDSLGWVLPPGESCKAVFAVVAARWNGSGLDGLDDANRRKNLYVSADWAQKAYDGEDINRNNQLDDDEDLNQNGILDRYILPEPPPSPAMTVVVGDQIATVYWSDNAESFIDPVSQEIDFEGYRVYGARKTLVEYPQEFTLLGEYDVYNPDDQNIGYNTGLDAVRITNAAGEPDSVAIDGVYYHYKFENRGVKNGWMNYYSVTAYDRGDPEANVASLESSKYANRVYVMPGSVPDTSGWRGQPSVYPNPYRGQANWDGYGSRDRMIWFQNLPAKAEIRIFTLAGDLVDIIQHGSDYIGQDVRNIDHNKNPLLSGGEHAWDLISSYDQAVASGLYLFTVEDLASNEVKEGKFLVIK
ncbi:MAG: hypothetical protein ABIA75_01060 [Candidatus Neomarinimicrobiota bacterium]